jgi:hypothetical protein
MHAILIIFLQREIYESIWSIHWIINIVSM